VVLGLAGGKAMYIFPVEWGLVHLPGYVVVQVVPVGLSV
jgi:hypothetical protein